MSKIIQKPNKPYGFQPDLDKIFEEYKNNLNNISQKVTKLRMNKIKTLQEFLRSSKKT